MDKIIRYYWVCYDTIRGEDFEEFFKVRDSAFKFFDNLDVPYKKIVACYNDHDVDLAIVNNVTEY